MTNDAVRINQRKSDAIFHAWRQVEGSEAKFVQGAVGIKLSTY